MKTFMVIINSFEKQARVSIEASMFYSMFTYRKLTSSLNNVCYLFILPQVQLNVGTFSAISFRKKLTQLEFEGKP